jgi:hypothetical protein
MSHSRAAARRRNRVAESRTHLSKERFQFAWRWLEAVDATASSDYRRITRAGSAQQEDPDGTRGWSIVTSVWRSKPGLDADLSDCYAPAVHSYRFLAHPTESFTPLREVLLRLSPRIFLRQRRIDTCYPNTRLFIWRRISLTSSVISAMTANPRPFSVVARRSSRIMGQASPLPMPIG